MDFIKTLPELADLEAPWSINSLEADLLRDAVAELCDADNQNERLRPAVENLVYVLNHHWLMWAHNWELTVGYEETIPQQPLAEPETPPLCNCLDVYELTVDVVCGILARLLPLGIQLDNASSDALHLALEKVLGEAKTEWLNDDGSPSDPNEQYRPQVEV